MGEKTRQLAFDFAGSGEARSGRNQGRQAAPARDGEQALAQGLMEAVVAPENVRRALRRVKANSGSPGVDGMAVEQLEGHLREHWGSLKARLLEGSYRPAQVRRAEIPKPGGGVRKLGIPTTLDRFIQQALLQVLGPLWEPTFSDSSYGFRPGRSAHDAVRAAQEHVAGGRRWVVDLDLERFFDRVHHDLLMSLLGRRIRDKRVLKLIGAYLRAGVMVNGVVIQRDEGTPQGGPLSPLLANVLLDELDKELERRGHSFCRYADDCNIYVRSERAGQRVMSSVGRWLERKLRLKVNRAKSAVGRPGQRKFLGLRLVDEGEVHIGLAPESITRFKRGIREITNRNRGVNLAHVIEQLNRYTRGWANYFAIATQERIFKGLDGWIRRRLRCFLWKQWKTTRARVRHLMRSGTERRLAWGLCNGKGHGPWSVARHTAMHRAVSNQYLEQQGYQSLHGRYLALNLA